MREWFAGVAANSPTRMRAVTTGNARQQTDNLISSVQKQAKDNNVTLAMKVPLLVLAPQPATGLERPVSTRFQVDIYADMGFASVKAKELKSTITFVTARLPDGSVKIVSIEGDLEKLAQS